MKFLIQGHEIDPLSLPHREASIEERKKMLGSLATLYEMKIPVVHLENTNEFYPLTNENREVNFESSDGVVILHTDIELPSIFRKPKKKRRLGKAWR